jgi:hypothetical protein
MNIEPATPAALGYRKLPDFAGQLPPGLIERLVQVGDYQTMPVHWIRGRARRCGIRTPHRVEVAATFDAETPLDDEHLAFIDRHSRSPWTVMEAEGVRLRGEFPTLVEILEGAEAEDRWRGLYRLAQALFFAGPERLRPMFRNHVAPCFFKLYPRGKIVVFRYDAAVDEAAASLRLLYALAQTPLPELTQGDFRGIRTMWQWHLTSLTGLMPAILAFFDYLFYPHVGGTCAGLIGLTFHFLMDPPERHESARFPRNWLGFASRSASFARESADTVAIVQDFGGPAHRRESHHRYCHEQGFTAEERLDLLNWYVGRWNRLLYELTDAANFTEGHDPEAAIDPVFGYEHQLTVDRLFRKTVLAMSLDEAPTANLSAFEIADLYDTLSMRFGNKKNATDLYRNTEFFKALFHPVQGPQILGPGLAGLPGPFARYFTEVADKVYQQLGQTVMNSVWNRGKVRPDGILVRDRELSREDVMPGPDFVAEVMRCYRNAHHGYFSADPSSQNRPSRFLYLVDGNLPVEMSALPVLWWLAYLADPGMVGWRQLPVGAFP